MYIICDAIHEVLLFKWAHKITSKFKFEPRLRRHLSLPLPDITCTYSLIVLSRHHLILNTDVGIN